MKRLTYGNRFLLLLLAIFAMLPCTVLAHDHGERGKKSNQLKIHGHHEARTHHEQPAQPPRLPAQRGSFDKHARNGAPFMQPPLFLLLAEKYNPQSTATWRSTLAEHQRLLAEMRKLLQANRKLARALQSQHTEDLRVKLERDATVRRQLHDAVNAHDRQRVVQILQTILNQLTVRNKWISVRLQAMKNGAGNP